MENNNIYLGNNNIYLGNNIYLPPSQNESRFCLILYNPTEVSGRNPVFQFLLEN